MSYATHRRRYGAASAPKAGRTGAAYRAAIAEVRTRARRGEPCCFCGGGFDWALHHNDARAFTAHHGARLMEGGAPVPDPSTMFPAHRACNSRDGLQAQNQRRRTHQQAPTYSSDEPHSRRW